jgi:hypothetical protein
MTQLQPFYQNIRAHYDLSNEFYELFLDPTMTYSSAFFAREDMSLEEAQRAKIDMALVKADIRAGQRVLEIGFGWGYTMRHAAEQYGANMLGITLSQAQFDYVERAINQRPPQNGSLEIRIQGWEEFDSQSIESSASRCLSTSAAALRAVLERCARCSRQRADAHPDQLALRLVHAAEAGHRSGPRARAVRQVHGQRSFPAAPASLRC